ncbi:hypothetical protein C1646_776326 [Rhizophagus diaphanus]|nr:hypothetical protein C1646_776326 [Rhizophagus diaphanus] [Rhizophagus sp. MUCL 43196]
MLKNINENTQQFKTCNICRHKATLQYEQSNQSNTEVKLLTPEEMSKQLFERILEINTNKYLENDLTNNIDFNCNISKNFLTTSTSRDLSIYIFTRRKSMRNPLFNSNRDTNTLSNITNLI